MRSTSAWLASRAASMAMGGSMRSRVCMISAGLVSGGAPLNWWLADLGQERAPADLTDISPSCSSRASARRTSLRGAVSCPARSRSVGSFPPGPRRRHWRSAAAAWRGAPARRFSPFHSTGSKPIKTNVLTENPKKSLLGLLMWLAACLPSKPHRNTLVSIGSDWFSMKLVAVHHGLGSPAPGSSIRSTGWCVTPPRCSGGSDLVAAIERVGRAAGMRWPTRFRRCRACRWSRCGCGHH